MQAINLRAEMKLVEANLDGRAETGRRREWRVEDAAGRKENRRKREKGDPGFVKTHSLDYNLQLVESESVGLRSPNAIDPRLQFLALQISFP